MKHWTGTDIYSHNVCEGEHRIQPGYPAAEGAIITADGNIRGFYEIETIPNTSRMKMYTDPTSFIESNQMVVDVICRHRLKNESNWHEAVIIAPVALFGMMNTANNAYDRAMKGI